MVAVATAGLVRDNPLFVACFVVNWYIFSVLFNFARKWHAWTILSLNCTTKRYESDYFSWTKLVAIFISYVRNVPKLDRSVWTFSASNLRRPLAGAQYVFEAKSPKRLTAGCDIVRYYKIIEQT
jgi:hypothetical protein